MKKLIKLVIAMCAAAVFSTLFMMTASADVSYALDSTNTVLTITGSGAIPDYTVSKPAPWYQYRATIKNVVIGSGVESIGSYAFYNCSKIEAVSIPDTVTEIGTGAFYGNTSITTLIIPEKVTKIGNAAFNGCTKLNILYFYPKKCKTAGSESYPPFSGCSALSTIAFGDGVEIIPDYCFALTGITSLTLPDTVKTVGEGAFYGCKKLINVTLPSTLSTLEYRVFRDCTALQRVTSPALCTTIGAQAFRGCSALTGFTFPELVTSIGDEAFRGCTSMGTLDISYHVTQIGADAFKDSNLTINTTTDAYAAKYCKAYGYSYKATSASYGEITGGGSSGAQLSVNTSSDFNRVNGKLVIKVDFDTALTNECVHVAFYNSSNSVVDYLVIPIVKTKANEEIKNIYIVVNDINSAAYAKVFVWDSLESCMPISPFEKVEIKRP